VSYGPATSISTTNAHSCALTSGGQVKCWGDGKYGVLGNGSATDSSAPVDATAFGSSVSAIAAGYAHTCVVTSGGGVKCLGENSNGALGNGTGTSSLVAVDVSTLSSGVASVSAGAYFTCARTSAGGAKCWGGNSTGQLGNGATIRSLVPVSVSGLTSGVASIAAGYGFACALTTSGGVKCWGANDTGQLGVGEDSNGLISISSSSVPLDVVGLTSGVIAITASFNHACAVTAGGGVKCWGNNYDGELGSGSHGSGSYSGYPVAVTGLSGIVTVVAGHSHTCALTNTGGVKCWGSNADGQLGNNSSDDSDVPVDVVGLSSGVAALAAGVEHVCALTTTGNVRCWGGNQYGGELGNHSAADSPVPVAVIGFP
jgi:alpha-tubulin suppressor-like RCC1 family protein